MSPFVSRGTRPYEEKTFIQSDITCQDSLNNRYSFESITVGVCLIIDELETGDDAFELIRKEVPLNNEIPEAMFPLLEEFSEVFLDEMSPGEHEELCRHIEELVSKGYVHEGMSACAQPRGPIDLMSLYVFGFVPMKVLDFVEGLPYHSDSSDDDLVENSRRNFVYPWGNNAGLSVEERTLLFLEAQDRVKKNPLFKVA
uniref:Putative reverse transcriptase domain-containing protein n=1 Tax=Tanacetum cinerariifolium TaxID=118510 RepID=A0A6L2JR50_TANCI|nr:putative reverse transcriptase domain-containing protein [Tanacetum cinerariifolium]